MPPVSAAGVHDRQHRHQVLPAVFGIAVPLAGDRRILRHAPARRQLPICGLGDEDHWRPPIKTGAEYPSLYFQPAYPGGQFSFNRKQTGLNPLSSSSSQGDALASALLGFGSGGAVTVDYPTANT